ncbi:hypothetical protein N6L24_05365 [Cognatishimia sp. SS12]|uniref:hypothetical protein n=1 Tax=Cognatishimia sp. SS12 TaxID=2979465 RepID=UPI0023315482|nr:hypothetical protein [Cognatishimia sp. SS12]MDC0737697.1 hypothetical protein [Cognatishimia sp. SS12]
MHQIDTTAYLTTYFKIRTALGLIAAAFPIVILLGGYITEGAVLPSISDYYFSSMRDFVVGALVAIGIFLMFYRGDRPRRSAWQQDVLGLSAGLASIGLALFPNKPHTRGVETFFHAIMDDRISVTLHFLSSFVFLTALTAFCLIRFAETASAADRRIYRICGWMVISAGLAATFASFMRAFDWFSARSLVENLHIIFWLEALGIWAFCLAWLRKGYAERQIALPAQADQSSRHLASRWVPSQ